MFANFCIRNLPQSSDIGQNSDRSISNFWISDQFFTKVNSHNPRASHEIDMKFGKVTKLDKKNRATSKKFDDDIMSQIVMSLSFF